MSDIIITQENSAFIKLSCEKHIAHELSEYFTFMVPGYQFMPAYRSKMWDGKIRLFNKYTESLYAGLQDHVVRFAKDRSYSVSIPETNSTNITGDMVRKFIDEYLAPHSHGKRIYAHDHQVDAVRHAINKDRCLLLSPTASGKSLIIYSLIRYYLEHSDLPKDKKILVIVPTTSLVSQMSSDFAEYSQADKRFESSHMCHEVFQGRDKTSKTARVIISTWQSIYKMNEKFFSQFGAVFGDEAHMFKSKSLMSIMTKLIDCPYRIGTTGTLDGTQTHKLVLEGLFGPVYNVTNTKDLIEKKLLSNLKIDCILLQHNDDDKKVISRAKYFDELEFLVLHQKRNNFIAKMANTLSGNTLILFQLVEKHGKALHTLVQQHCPDKKVFFVHGGVDATDREKIRKIVEENDNAIIVASYGTFSTGISIRRLHNIIFSSPSKSRIRILQSIGRQLRKSDHKEIAKLYDIGDDLSWKTWKNHTLKHFVERVNIYNQEQFDYRMVNINL